MRRSTSATRRLRARRGSTSGDLNLTSLTDMFAFLLCVLLKSFSVNTVDIKPSAGMKLPNTSSVEQPHRYVALEIRRDGIYLEKDLLQPLKDFVLTDAGGAEANTGNQDTLFVLRGLIKARIERREIESTGMLIRAERDTPFDIIWRVMYTARQLGFDEFNNLAVHEQEAKKS